MKAAEVAGGRPATVIGAGLVGAGWTIAYRLVDIFAAADALGDQCPCFAQQHGLQTIQHKAFGFLVHAHHRHMCGLHQLVGEIYGGFRCLRRANQFDDGHQIRRVDRMRDQNAWRHVEVQAKVRGWNT